jgi:hypothetical protein
MPGLMDQTRPAPHAGLARAAAALRRHGHTVLMDRPATRALAMRAASAV